MSDQVKVFLILMLGIVICVGSLAWLEDRKQGLDRFQQEAVRRGYGEMQEGEFFWKDEK